MSSSALHGIFDIQSSTPKVASPAPTYQKSKDTAPQNLRDIGVLPEIELEQLNAGKNGKNGNGADDIKSADQSRASDVQNPKTPNELEMSRPSTPSAEDAVGMIRTWNGDPMTKWRILCCCVIYFSNGMNDSGKLIETDCRRQIARTTETRFLLCEY